MLYSSSSCYIYKDTEEVYSNPQNEYTKKLLASKTKTNPDELQDTEYEFEDVPSILD